MRVASYTMALVAILVTLAAAPLAATQIDEGVPRLQHPWGKFPVGSWKRVRTLTESLDDKGNVINSSTTETTTKLLDVDATTYTLRVDVVVEVAGKRFTAQPQIVRRGFNGEEDGQNVSVKRLGTEPLLVNGRKVSSEVREVTIDQGDTRRITTLYYSERVAPFVLRRETVSLDTTGKPTEAQSQVDVVAVDMPAKVLSEMKSTSHVRVSHQHGKATTLTLEVHCLDIPGGVVAHTSKETEESGRVIRRSTLELLDYGLGSGDDADAQVVRKVFHRARVRREAGQRR